MRYLFTIAFLALSILLVAGRERYVAQSDDALDDSPRALIRGLAPSKEAQKWHEATWERGPLVQRWRQWVRRQDENEPSSNERTATQRRSETRGTTQKEDAMIEEEAMTTEDEATTTQNKVTTTDEPESTTQEFTTAATSTQESSVSSTVLSTSTETSSTSSSTTSSTITSTEPGASCYSTTIETSIVCSITTDGHTESACNTIKMTSSTCAPGLFCDIHPDSGVTVCMEQHNEIGTEGIVVGAFFGACIAGCIVVLVSMCLKDKRAQKNFQNIKRAKTLRTMKTAKPEDEANLISGSSG
ncbi:uncharacterized protein BKA55DRAFT_526981 [Fusarium redolens]|uniref:Uncharacterized protein n=1 Tax=Fusarium redolens TaxID=48865 RepID=A0A9P9G1K9_FUSRE|nr:uncharacterized protein BKA55DRAFT_526981 [Fusarium redolens]KAH7227195.1 hypothetical protein BKA55DRAFT_526981 [Fusarium redolens]